MARCSWSVNKKNTPRSGGSPKPKKRSTRSARQKPRKQYRVRNWHDYDTALVNRGRLTLWLDPETLQRWRCETLQRWRCQDCTSKRGKPKLYSDEAIACALRLGAVYRLPLRATEGLLASLILLAGADVPVPDYSTLSRRRKKMTVSLSLPIPSEPLHLVVDGTGLKVFGDGEWKVRQHGTSKRRTWRKVHLAVDQKTGMIRAAAMTTNSISDGEMLPKLLEQIPQAIGQVSADGGYDRRTCYEAIAGRGAKAAIPPRRGARIWQHGNSKAECLARDENLRRIRRVGRAKWKRESGYHRRSLAETAMFRLKALFGATLRARSEAAQDTETMLRLVVLNKMTALGMPESYAL